MDKPCSATPPPVATAADLRAEVGREGVVIVDSGDSAELVLLPNPENIAHGARFLHGDQLWVVTAERRDSGILVAKPALK